MKPILKINSDGLLVERNRRLGRWEVVQRAWSWEDITRGYRRESGRNYKSNKG